VRFGNRINGGVHSLILSAAVVVADFRVGWTSFPFVFCVAVRLQSDASPDREPLRRMGLNSGRLERGSSSRIDSLAVLATPGLGSVFDFDLSFGQKYLRWRSSFFASSRLSSAHSEPLRFAVA
jgi:hypothetical protein